MNFIFGFIAGFIVGFGVSRFIFTRRHLNGEFHVNESNPEKDVYTLVMGDFNVLSERKYLLLKITRK